MKKFKLRFYVDDQIYETDVIIDVAKIDCIDLTELQRDIHRGVKSGNKKRNIVLL